MSRVRGEYTRQYQNKLAFEYTMSNDIRYTIFDGDQVRLAPKPEANGSFTHSRSFEYVFEVAHSLRLADGREISEVDIEAYKQTSLFGSKEVFKKARAEAEAIFLPMSRLYKLSLLTDL